MRPLTFWQRLGRASRDIYFVVGAVLVALLVLVAVVGPQVAPHNPFLVKPIQWIDGEIHRAPFAPGSVYPLGTDDLGRDQLSMLLYGARTTLVMALFATVVRLLLGLLLGTIAGWWPGSLFDRAVTALSEFLAAFPDLILAMLVIFAVGIERGQVAFVAALSVVGCGGVAQIMRGHVLTIRNEAYIEAARAVGLSSAGILSRHVLPNLLGTLLAIASLEMGAALLLLGELGFVAIFIGGGVVGFDLSAWETTHHFDVPDWGAMLGTSWRWFRSYPWFPLVPAGAFFAAIVGFNLFGYGLQRFVERGRFHPSGWSVLRVLLVTALVLFGARALLQGAGIEAQLAKLARDVKARRAQEDVALLAQPELSKPPTAEGDISSAAGYIAAQFEAAGLSRLRDSYFQTYTAYRGQVYIPPALELVERSGQPLYQAATGISLDPMQAFQGEGIVEGELVIGTVSRVRTQGILLLLDPEQQISLPWNAPPPFDAVLRVVPDEALMPLDQPPPFDNTVYLTPQRLPEFPNLLIGETAAQEVLALAGFDLPALRERLEAGEAMELTTGLRVRVSYGLRYEEITATNVVGYIPGVDASSRGERILVAASYAPEPRGDGVIPQGADENASGVAVMLETARLLHDLELIPKRSIVFAAFDEGGGARFVSNSGFPSDRSNSWTAIVLHGVGAGGARLARVESGAGLARAFDQSARRFGVRTEELDEWPFFFVSGRSRMDWTDATVHPAYRGLAVTRVGDQHSGTREDTPDRLDLETLERTGQTVAHFVLVLASR
jgi:peptide/nickel transport system permease protein